MITSEQSVTYEKKVGDNGGDNEGLEPYLVLADSTHNVASAATALCYLMETEARKLSSETTHLTALTSPESTQ